MLTTCISTCSLARECDRHRVNRPSIKMRDQKLLKYEPEKKTKCRGYLEVYIDDSK